MLDDATDLVALVIGALFLVGVILLGCRVR
jgi:hypothetical protein